MLVVAQVAMMLITEDMFEWMWCEKCEEKFLVPPPYRKCPRCSGKFAEQMTQSRWAYGSGPGTLAGDEDL